MLFLQRWWLTGQAVWRGFNVLSLDTDLHLASNPLEMLRRPPYASFDAIMQLDSAWPVECVPLRTGGYGRGGVPVFTQFCRYCFTPLVPTLNAQLTHAYFRDCSPQGSFRGTGTDR